MSSIEKLGQLFRDRDNPPIINITVGKVISVNPLNIQWGQNVLLTEKNLIVGSIFKSGVTKVGDKVIILPDLDFKTWYVIDKVG